MSQTSLFSKRSNKIKSLIYIETKENGWILVNQNTGHPRFKIETTLDNLSNNSELYLKNGKSYLLQINAGKVFLLGLDKQLIVFHSGDFINAKDISKEDLAIAKEKIMQFIAKEVSQYDQKMNYEEQRRICYALDRELINLSKIIENFDNYITRAEKVGFNKQLESYPEKFAKRVEALKNKIEKFKKQ